MKFYYLLGLALVLFQVHARADAYVKILEPDGVPQQPIQQPDKYIRLKPLCFEWQYVHVDNDVVGYYKDQPPGGIVGKVKPIPDASYNWDIGAGELTGRRTSRPRFRPGKMPLPNTRVDVDLILRAYPGNDDFMAQKTLEVYRDHLERDLQNFQPKGLNAYCGSPKIPDFYWSFPRYGIDKKACTVRLTFNCFGSVWHAYNGSKAQSDAKALPKWKLTWAEDEPINWDNITSRAQRGDYITYCFRESSDLTPEPKHAATFLDSISTFGANNEPTYDYHFRYDECGRFSKWWGTPWIWWKTTPKDYYDKVNQTYQNHHPGELIVNHVRLYRKPSSP